MAQRGAIEPVEREIRARSAHVCEIRQRWEKASLSPAAPGRDQLRLDVDAVD
ncbi:MAG TPA: hypothetical protein VLK58_17855 [Conexibacter sp.]|nr:hypothetical protein [Conexibacter sp.]